MYNLNKILLWILLFCSLPCQASHLDQYYSQIENNIYADIRLQSQQLLKNTPLDSFIIDYMQRGFEVINDKASLFYYFEINITPLSFPEQHALVDELYEAARHYKSKRLKLLTDFFKGRLMNNYEDTFESKMEWMEELISNTCAINDSYLEAHTLTEMWFSSYYSERYARSFQYAQRLSDALDKIDDDYPCKGLQYIWLGIAYFKFKDYDKACYYFHKGLEYRKPSYALIAGNYFRAWNHLASYYLMKNEPDSAAHYLHTLLYTEESIVNLPVHTHFGICNLGIVEMQKGNYDTAITMLEAGLKNMTGDGGDLEFKAGVHALLGECYLKKGKLPEVQAHIKEGWRIITVDFYEVDRFNRIRALYALESKYYSHLGQYEKAALYLDSALQATSHYEHISGQSLILLGEQTLKEAEIQHTTQQLAWQRKINVLIIVLLGSMFVTMLIVVNLYRKQREAYQSLAQKAKEWADTPETVSAVIKQINTNTLPDEEDIKLSEEIQAYMIAHKPYKEADLTLEILADRMGVSRHKLSRAINQATGQHFNQYINEFRIKEAIRLMSESESHKLSMDELMEQAGFSGRTSFYQSFKKVTGLTPAQYWKNSR